METRANYALIGLFTLAVIAASFLFIYWVSIPGRSGSQQTYKIIFTGSINGLSRGGWVMFNGMRVGEVKDINLVPQDPQHVYAIINIDSRVPIRADTKAHLEFDGLHRRLERRAGGGQSRCRAAAEKSRRWSRHHLCAALRLSGRSRKRAPDRGTGL